MNFKRAALASIAVAGMLAVIVLLGLHFATRALKERVEQALGPESEVAEVVVGWSSIELRDIRVKSPPGWPVPETLRAERVTVHPDLLGLLSNRVHVPRVVVEKAYVSALRTRDGKLRVLPTLVARSTQGENAEPGRAFSIGTVELRHGVLEFFDASVRQPAHKTRIEQLHARVDGLQLPALSGRTRITVDGTVKGVRRDGRLSIDGWAELADRNSEIATKLQGVDLVALQPYLVKAAETGVRRGTLDLRLKSTVQGNRLRAPGTLTLNQLELAPGGGPLATFMGVPRQAVIGALKDRNNQITVNFTLEGNLNDPAFSLNDSLSRRIGAGVAETLGISIEGLSKGVSGAAEGLGGVVRKLFGK